MCMILTKKTNSVSIKKIPTKTKTLLLTICFIDSLDTVIMSTVMKTKCNTY